MCQLIESILLKNGTLHNLEYHNHRLNHSRHSLFGLETNIDLFHLIHPPEYTRAGTYKCRVLYDKKHLSVSFHPYTPRKINSLKLVADDNISYEHKFENRTALNSLLNQKSPCDDIIIVKNNSITDASYANLLFFDGNRWITPSTPLLQGTKRNKLLAENQISEALISPQDLPDFLFVSLINAMLDPGEIILPIKNIYGF